MPVFSLRLNKEEIEDLESRANEKKEDIHIFAKQLLFPNMKVNDKALNHNEVLKRIKDKPYGYNFSIPELFSPAEWDEFDNTITIGRTFRKAEKNKDSIVGKNVRFYSKKSGQSARYEKIKSKMEVEENDEVILSICNNILSYIDRMKCYENDDYVNFTEVYMMNEEESSSEQIDAAIKKLLDLGLINCGETIQGLDEGIRLVKRNLVAYI